MKTMPAVYLLAACLLAACQSALPPLPGAASLSGSDRSHAASLLASVDRLVEGGGNLGRLNAARERARALGLEAAAHTEWIDWFSLQRNLRIDLPGTTDDLVYVVAHYDKTDANPFKFASLLVNGLLDELIGLTFLTEGAVDNATGVAVALELAAALKKRETRLSYRILLTGSEESGLRGARAHVARLSPAERGRIRLAINIDSVGLADHANCVTTDLSDETWVTEALRAAEAVEANLGFESIPAGAATDVAPFRRSSFLHELRWGLAFNLVGGLLPQRSWFTRSHRAPTLNFSACRLIDWSDRLGGGLLPMGRLHGPRDRRSRVDPLRLFEQYAIVEALIDRLEAGATAPEPM